MVSRKRNKLVQLRTLLNDAIKAFKEQGIESARLDAQLLMMHVTNMTFTQLTVYDDKDLSEQDTAAFKELVAKRLAGHPIAHLTGTRDFWSLSLKVTSDTLIPRPDTEVLVEKALELIDAHAFKSVLDLGTGTGAIILSIKKERPALDAWAVDFSKGALDVAIENAKTNNLNVTFKLGSWFEALKSSVSDEVQAHAAAAAASNNVSAPRFDLIVSNPPYIEEGDPHLSSGDVRFEPKTALVSGKDGLDDIRLIADQARSHLTPNGFLVFEHGYNQAAAVRNIMTVLGYIEVGSQQDYGGNDRITFGRYKGNA